MRELTQHEFKQKHMTLKIRKNLIFTGGYMLPIDILKFTKNSNGSISLSLICSIKLEFFCLYNFHFDIFKNLTTMQAVSFQKNKNLIRINSINQRVHLFRKQQNGFFSCIQNIGSSGFSCLGTVYSHLFIIKNHTQKIKIQISNCRIGKIEKVDFLGNFLFVSGKTGFKIWIFDKMIPFEPFKEYLRNVAMTSFLLIKEYDTIFKNKRYMKFEEKESNILKLDSNYSNLDKKNLVAKNNHKIKVNFENENNLCLKLQTEKNTKSLKNKLKSLRIVYSKEYEKNIRIFDLSPMINFFNNETNESISHLFKN